jgi:hypothetical protein
MNMHIFISLKVWRKDVIYDTAIYTLRLHHESELYEAEHRAAKHFEYKKINYEEMKMEI